MPSPFVITTATNTVNLDNKLHGVAAFTVTNATRRHVKAIAKVVVDPVAGQPWVTLAPSDTQNGYDFPVDSTQQIQVKIDVPPGTAPASYTLKLLVADDLNPDDNFSESPDVVFTIREAPPAPAPRPPLPKWVIPAVIIGAVLIVVIIAAVVILSNRPQPQIAFTALQNNTYKLYLLNVNDRSVREVSNVTQVMYATWSPDGKQIAFDSSQDGNSEIYVMNVDGSQLHNLTQNPADDSAPAWSPDGKQIAFNSRRDGNFEIYLMNAADGSQLQNLTNSPATDGFPAWSPDGKHIVFQSSARNGVFNIFVMDMASRNVRQCTNNNNNDFFPRWSPDGKEIVFEATQSITNLEIYVIDADCSQTSRDISNNTKIDTVPAWSPDGKQLAFASDRDGNDSIYLMSADGTDVQRLTTDDFGTINTIVWRP